MLLSVGSETFPQAPILPHPSRGGGSNCPTRWSQLSDKVVLIFRQNLAIRVIGTTLSGQQDHFRLKQGGPYSRNKWSQIFDGSNSPTYSISSRKAQNLMIKTSLRIILKIYFLHLHHNKCQNLRTPPLPSYKATPTLLEGTIVSLVRVGVALQESRGRSIVGYG